MKSKKAAKQVKISQEQSDYGDCSCQMLDTSLEGVGQSDCSCSECLQANLQAFNQLKQEEQNLEKEQNYYNNRRGGSTRPASNKQTREVSRNTIIENKSTARIGGFKSSDKMRETRPKTAIRRQQNEKSQVYENQQSKSPTFSRQCINDYIKITRHRAREYLKERKGLQRSEQQKKNELKSLIKENLQALQYTVKNLISKKEIEGQQERAQSQIHRFKWGHNPYHCKSRVQCRKLKTYEPNLEEKKEQIEKINKRIEQYVKEHKQKPYQCPDKCPRHHMRTSKQKISQIQTFIQKNVKAYKQSQLKAQQQKKDKQQIKEAKLRAIDLKCKQKVIKSKKYDKDEQRTSFHNSIDHFSTFSQLRLNNQQKIQQRKKRKKIKEALKDGKQLQQAIYQNLQEELIEDHPQIHSKINVESRYVQGQSQQEQWCQKIVKDARIKPPKDLKKEDKDIKKQKDKKNIQRQKQRQNNAQKNKKNLSTKDLRKQQQRRKQIEAEIQRKKQQILILYQKRNSTVNKNQPKNKALRQQYEQQINQGRKSNKNAPRHRQQPKNDPYRQNYKHQASRDVRQMNIVGDPLIQEYQYQQKSKRARQLQVDPTNKEIFMNSGKQLMQKKVLKI